MSSRAPIVPSAFAAALVVALAAPQVHANLCDTAERAVGLDCLRSCALDSQNLSNTCLTRDLSCLDVCGEQRLDCRDATGLDAAYSGCDAQLATTAAGCLAQFPGDPLQRFACVFAAAKEDARCREQARDADRGALQHCRQQFFACADACPTGTTRFGSRTACLKTTAATLAACQAACQSTLSAAKMFCELEPGCEAACAQQLVACRAPVLARLILDDTTCKTTLTSTRNGCLSIPDPTARQACINAGLATEFECRVALPDQQEPAFDACRVTFQECALACPTLVKTPR
jgi:hypothetical protein